MAVLCAQLRLCRIPLEYEFHPPQLEAGNCEPPSVDAVLFQNMAGRENWGPVSILRGNAAPPCTCCPHTFADWDQSKTFDLRQALPPPMRRSAIQVYVLSYRPRQTLCLTKMSFVLAA